MQVYGNIIQVDNQIKYETGDVELCVTYMKSL